MEVHSKKLTISPFGSWQLFWKVLWSSPKWWRKCEDPWTFTRAWRVPRFLFSWYTSCTASSVSSFFRTDELNETNGRLPLNRVLLPRPIHAAQLFPRVCLVFYAVVNLEVNISLLIVSRPLVGRQLAMSWTCKSNYIVSVLLSDFIIIWQDHRDDCCHFVR